MLTVWERLSQEERALLRIWLEDGCWRRMGDIRHEFPDVNIWRVIFVFNEEVPPIISGAAIVTLPSRLRHKVWTVLEAGIRQEPRTTRLGFLLLIREWISSPSCTYGKDLVGQFNTDLNQAAHGKEEVAEEIYPRVCSSLKKHGGSEILASSTVGPIFIKLGTTMGWFSVSI